MVGMLSTEPERPFLLYRQLHILKFYMMLMRQVRNPGILILVSNNTARQLRQMERGGLHSLTWQKEIIMSWVEWCGRLLADSE
ncbi:hypothetical protein AO738_13620 [Pseudomonas citronellolis]|nr:hypothetical protein AO742_12645 [Pseudomonas citronellolis]KRW79591.1 hypothetical protein AO738_13620 [Pseudomonas citronellolis]